MNKMHRCALLFCLVSLFFFAFTRDVRADQITLDNGDSLSGTIEKIVAGKLTLKTDYAGSIDIDITKIKKVSTSSPVEVRSAGRRGLERAASNGRGRSGQS